MLDNCIVRKYRSTDKEDLKYICRSTATPSHHKSMDCVTIMYNDYYTEKEPENIFVLANKFDKAVGYIICSTNYDKWLNAMQNEYMDKLIEIDKSEAETLKKNVIFNHETVKERSNHFHIDILPNYQRHGYGHKLIEKLCDKLKQDNINYISVVRIKKNSGSYNLCIQEGFYVMKDYGDGTVSLTKDII